MRWSDRPKKSINVCVYAGAELGRWVNSGKSTDRPSRRRRQLTASTRFSVQSTVMTIVSLNALSSRVAVFPWWCRSRDVIVALSSLSLLPRRPRLDGVSSRFDVPQTDSSATRSPVFTCRCRCNRIPIYRASTPARHLCRRPVRDSAATRESAEACSRVNEVKTRRLANKRRSLISTNWRTSSARMTGVQRRSRLAVQFDTSARKMQAKVRERWWW